MARGHRRRSLHRQSALRHPGRQRRTSPSAERAWKAIGAEICEHRDFPAPDQCGICAHRERARDRDSHLRARRRPHHFFRHRQLRLGHCRARFAPLRLAAHRRRPRRRADRRLGRARRQSCISPARPRSSPAGRRGEHGMRLLKPPAVAPGAAISIVAPASSAKPSASSADLAALRSLGYAPRPGRNALLAARSTLPEPLSSASPICTRPSPIPEPAPSCAFAAATDRIICSTASISNHRRASQAILRLQRSDRHPAPPARPDWPSRFSRPHARRRFLSSQTACILKAFAPHWPASLTASAPPKACALSSPPHRAVRGTLYGGCLSILASLLGTPWEPQPKASCSFLRTSAPSPTRSIACCGSCAMRAKLEGVRGIIFGEMLDCVSPGARARSARRSDSQRARRLRWPIAIGLRSGHVSRAECHAHLRRRSRTRPSPNESHQLTSSRDRR